MPIETPRGVRDFSPAETISMRYIIDVIEEVYKRFGFYPIETPAVESMSTLSAKAYGEEPAGQIYKIEGEETGLRYDLTVPLARYVAANKDITMPFKRYQIGASWRREEPQKMRYREFVQADLDVVGSRDVSSDAEAIAAAAMALEELGIRNYIVVLNSRQLLQKILAFFRVPADKQVQVIRVLDKLQKFARSDILKQLAEAGVAANTADELLNFVEQDGSNDEKLERVSANVAGARADVEAMGALLATLKNYGLAGNISVDFALARGLSYYTGFVFEYVLEEDGKRLPSVAAGGRYDNLIGLYAKREVPAVGVSLGINRLYDVLRSEGGVKTYAKVYVAYIGLQNASYATTVATQLRGNGVYVDLNTTDRNLSKQLEYAGSLKIANVMIIGDKEREASKVKLRNMQSGQEELISVQEAIARLKG